METNQVELSKFGSQIDRSLVMVGDSFAYQNRFLTPEWDVLFVPNSYQGIWINRAQLKLCSYTEGDIVITSAKDADSFQREIGVYQDWMANEF
tara:strand:+ start:10794 stop:11072 length:279 start_codon:yes stop_codon:yes gene_type:complete